MKRILLMCLILFAVFMHPLAAQDRTVSGKVTSADDGTALPGVNVVVKSTNIGTTTNADGNYSLAVPTNATLVFSFIGLTTQEIAVGNRSVVDVKLASDVQALSEVVVTAVGIERQAKELGYSVSKINTGELNQAKALNAATALSGKVAGLQINTVNNGVNPSTRVVLRGNRSLLGNNQALVVIDGSQVPQTALDYLNPNDIDNITVLKGANAAALYGSDAANGALIITTKKGSNTAPRLTFSNTSSIEQVSFLPDFQNRFGPGTASYSRLNIPYENQSYGPEFSNTGSGLTLIDEAETVLPFNQFPLGKRLEDGTYQTLPYVARPDEKKKIWNTGSTIQNDVSLSAGSERSTFFISIQDVNTKGVVPKDEYRRTGARFNATHTYGKFKAGFNLGYALTNSRRTTSDFYFFALNAAANIPITQYKNWENFRNEDGSLNYANPNNYYNDYYNNPYFELDNNRQNVKNGNLTGNFELSFKPTTWLNLLGRVGITNRTYFSKAYTGKFEYRQYAKDHIYRARDINGRVEDFSGYENRITSDFLGTVNKEFGDFSANLIVGGNIRENTSKFQSTAANALVVPGVYNVSNRVGEPTVNENNFRSTLVGAYADVTFGFRDYLFLHASGRNDWTSLLAKENRSFFYPGADISFVLSDAVPAIKENNILSFAKLRASASKVGSVNVGPYGLQAIFDPGAGFPYGSTAGYTVGNSLPDPGLKPEFTTSYEVGGELGFFNNRINLELAYYKQNTTNQTVFIDVSSTTGYSRALINAGETENSGYEIDLRTTPIELENGFKWDVNVNYSNVDTKVISLYQGLDEISLSAYYGIGTSDNNASIFARVGEQYPIIKMTNYKRDPQGRVVVDPATGYPLQNPDGLVIAGQTNPRHRLGINTTLSFKGFNLSALAEYRGGNVIYHDLGWDLTFTGVAKVTETYGRERFVFPNSVVENADGSYTPNTNITVADGGVGYWDNNFKKFGENFVTSGAFWKLREVSLGYSIPASVLSATKYIKGASISLVGRNLLMLLPKSNLYTDPEFSVNNSNAVGINDSFNTPPTRTYGVNVTLTF
jgi:TonB-linked SusC/RagA family outer membrane protein